MDIKILLENYIKIQVAGKIHKFILYQILFKNEIVSNEYDLFLKSKKIEINFIDQYMNAEEIVHYAHNLYNGGVEIQQQAADFYFRLMKSENVFSVGLDVLENYNDLYSNYAAIHVFNNIVNDSWYCWPKELQTSLKMILFRIINDKQNRHPVIIDSASKIIAHIALNEFPDNWSTFICDITQQGNFQIFIYFFEDLDGNRNIPSLRRNQIHDIFVEAFDFIKSAIFKEPITIPQIKLFHILSSWMPIDLVVSDTLISILLGLLKLENMKENVIECLYVLFVQRYDCIDQFENFHQIILSKIYEEALNDKKCAWLLAKIICAHLPFFSKVINYSYPNYNCYSFIFQLLVNPGWCDDLIHDNDNIDSYWRCWRLFLDFASRLRCKKEENHVLLLIPQLFIQMAEIIHTTIDSELIIKDDARLCFATFWRYEHDFIAQQLTNAQPTIQLFYVATCCLGGNDLAFFEELMTSFLNIDMTPELLTHLIPCLARFLKFFPNNSYFLQFFSSSIENIFKITNDNHENQSIKSLQNSAIFALNYISINNQKLFKMNNCELLDNVIGFLVHLDIVFIKDSFIQTLYKIIAQSIADIADPNLFSEFLNKSLELIIKFINFKTNTILTALQEEYEIFVQCFYILYLFASNCPKFSVVLGSQFIEIIHSLLFSIEFNDRDYQLIKACYCLSSAIINGVSKWDLGEPLFNKILEPSFLGNEKHFSFAVEFLTSVHKKFRESDVIFPIVFEKLIKPIMTEINEDSKYIIDYLLYVEFWKYGLDLPIEFLNATIHHLPLASAKQIILILHHFCNSFHLPHVQQYIIQQNSLIYDFLVSILVDSIYNIYFTKIVRAFMSFSSACCELQIPYELLHQMMFSVLINRIPRIKDHNLFLQFLEYVRQNFKSQKMMENGLRNLIISSHCCLPTTSNLFETDENSNGLTFEESLQTESSEFLEKFDFVLGAF
ncbi:hypothetical protein TRFO_20809 [Tritrichomonas foetus]|uniref:Importin N-terminal domain-containing protein n=1 Tax=Tritrichomonas foetus TaxID=1144522 RepID=A0A1J4KGB1_9EUKA|nr:hypothetical protein TRFO_20809 [Tritrichomonas foetus]|eukprot:OHT10074.1 hypothetical protein TRFO_20809 [Tritrichomonas foetus]